MKVTVDLDELRGALRASSAISAFTKVKEENDYSVPCLLSTDKRELVVECSMYGIYIKHRLPAKVSKEGTVAIDATLLAKVRGTGSALILSSPKSNTISIKSKASNYEIQKTPAAEEVVIAGRPNLKKLTTSWSVKLPLSVIRDSIGTVSFKPAHKEETLIVQMKVKKKGKLGSFELTGLDSYSFARIVMEGEDIEAQDSMEAVVKTELLSKVTKELMGDDQPVSIGIMQDSSGRKNLIRFRSKTFDLFHPLLEVPLLDMEKKLRGFLKKHKVNCVVESTRSKLSEAIDNVVAISKGGSSALLNFDISKKRTWVSADLQGNKGKSPVDCEVVSIRGKQQDLCLHEGYLKAFLQLAPEVVPLRMESCGDAYVIIRATNLETSSIEYLLAKASPRDLGSQEKEES